MVGGSADLPATRVLSSPLDIFHAGGRDAEMEEVFRRVAASNLPLDQVEIACVSCASPLLAWEKAARFDWPVTLSAVLVVCPPDSVWRIIPTSRQLTRTEACMGIVHPVLVAGDWRPSRKQGGTLRAFNPQTGEARPDEYPVSSFEELHEVVQAGVEAAEALDECPIGRRVQFFELFAGAIDRDREELAAAAHLETALPVSPRLLDVEIPRTTRQLRMAADVLRGDAWRGQVADQAADLLSEFHPLGAPVLVIGPNNFPFAFNAVAGGDFAAALAAGNPVIAKAHPGHPETTRRLAELCAASAAEAGLPKGVVQMFYHCSPEDGLRLAGQRALGAIAFTGSRPAGLRLKAAADAQGVLFYGELSAANPVFLLPGALEERRLEIAHELFTSMTLGCGQFCTRPAIVALVGDDAGERFLAALRQLVGAAASQVLLGSGVRDRFHRACEALVRAGASRTATGRVTRTTGFAAEPVLLEASAAAFLRAPRECQLEAFGPMTLIVKATDEGELLGTAREIEGTLTASVYTGTASADALLFHRLRSVLIRRCGRFVVNKMPTGVTVSPAMNHGGPWPATTHPGFTAVGLPRSMQRFMALKCFDPASAR